MRNPYVNGALALAATLACLPAAAGAAAPGAERCVSAARIFIEGLVPEQRKRAVRSFDHPLRTQPMFPPGSAPAGSGIRVGELADGQRIRLHDFLTCALSSQGYQKVIAVIRRDDVVADTLAQLAPAERETAANTGSLYYWITLFGEPDPQRPWGWRLEGHHLSLNFTAAGGELSMSPTWIAADPAVMVKGLWAGFRVLDTEFSRGLELLESLEPPQRQRAVLSAELPPGMFTTPDRRSGPTQLSGLPAAAMNEAQRALLWRLIDEYVGEAEPGTAARIRARIEADGIDKVNFAWMGPTVRGQPVYYRVQGPAIEIEFLHGAASSKAAPDVNHIHTWWRVPGSDFGADLAGAGATSTPRSSP